MNKKAKKSCLIVISLIFILGYFVLASPATTIYVEPASQSVANGSSFKINVSINTDENAYGAQFDLYFDASILEASGVIEGDFFKQGASTYFSGGTIDNVNGKINDVYITRTGTQTTVNGTGSIAEISFNTKNYGTSNLTLDEVKATKVSGGNIIYITGITIQNGSITVTSPEVISITFSDTSIEFGSLNPGQQGAGNGTYNLTIESSGNVDIYQYGDNYTSLSETITINNMKWNSANNNETALDVTSTYSKIFDAYSSGIYSLYYWLNIPSAQPQGDYQSIIYIKAVNAGSPAPSSLAVQSSSISSSQPTQTQIKEGEPPITPANATEEPSEEKQIKEEKGGASATITKLPPIKLN